MGILQMLVREWGEKRVVHQNIAMVLREMELCKTPRLTRDGSLFKTSIFTMLIDG